jgi:hypothetical protein
VQRPPVEILSASANMREAGITVAEVCDWYLKEAEAGRILKRRGKRIKPSTIRRSTPIAAASTRSWRP